MAEMDVFLSWSRPASRQAAGAFKQWFHIVLPGTSTWMSKVDITKGEPWFASISTRLAEGGVCLICITPENVESSWLHFEAGAIAHASWPKGLICPYLIGLEASSISGTPLGQYQATLFEKEDTWLLIKSLNGRCDHAHNEQLLRGTFDARWPSLQRKLNRLTLPSAKSKPSSSQRSKPSPPPVLDDTDIICLLEAWMGKRSQSDNQSAISFAEVDRELGLPDGSAARLIEQAARKFEYVADKRGATVITFRKVRRADSAPTVSNSGWDDPRNPYKRRR